MQMIPGKRGSHRARVADIDVVLVNEFRQKAKLFGMCGNDSRGTWMRAKGLLFEARVRACHTRSSMNARDKHLSERGKMLVNW